MAPRSTPDEHLQGRERGAADPVNHTTCCLRMSRVALRYIKRKV
jgi:hypothetical protein